MTLKPNRFKNCSDIALVIGAMDLLVERAAHGKPHGVGRGPEHPKHIDRVAYIRKFISDQLSENNGQMASATLFNLLNELPDYVYDQQRSKRTPLDYL